MYEIWDGFIFKVISGYLGSFEKFYLDRLL